MQDIRQGEGVAADVPLYGSTDHPILTWLGHSIELYLQAIETEYHGLRITGQEGYDKVRWKFDYTPGAGHPELRAYHSDEHGECFELYGRFRSFTIDQLALLYEGRV